MSRKEVQINGKWYFELEATDQNQAFNPPEPAYMWDNEPTKISYLCFVIKKGIGTYPFKTEICNGYAHCAMLSSEHEKKSRRCTNFELVRWCAKGNGFWIDECGITRTKCDAPYADRNDPSGKGLVSICTWDGEPMEPTAQNMGLPE